MKKQCVALIAALLLSSTSLVEAKAAQWSLLGENPSGSYYTDLQSFKKNAKEPETTHAAARAVFKNTSFIRLLNEQYGGKLKALDSASECFMQVSLNLKAKTYKIDEIELRSKKGRTLDKKKVNEAFSPIPEKTFVEALANEASAWQVEQAHKERLKQAARNEKLRNKAAAKPQKPVKKAKKGKIHE